MFICPNCQSALSPAPTAWRCKNGHAFDVGKHGDVNVLLANQKRSQSPGDSKAMVAARRDFLSAGFYQPIAELLSKYVTVLSQGMPAVVADAGCGEGYYLRHIQRLCYPQPPQDAAFIGWDIAKYAAQAAAKAGNHPAMTYLTASNAAIPLAENSVDILLSVFGFAVDQEFARVVKATGQGGYIVTVDAGERHLIELRELIYPTLKPYQEKALLSEAAFVLRKRDTMTYEITLDKSQLQQLLLMTPHLYRASSAGKAAVAAQSELTVTVDAALRIYQVKP